MHRASPVAPLLLLQRPEVARMRALRPSIFVTVGAIALIPALLGACGNGKSGAPVSSQRQLGQSDYTSAPLPGSAAVGNASAGAGFAGPSQGSGGASTAVPATGGTTTTVAPTVQETDIYRVDGNRLYYLNSYRGLMVFDVTNVDQPVLLGRSPIFGDPQEMFVNDGVAVVVVGDWYGTSPDGSPFYGSLARGLDCTDPTNIKNVGDAYLRGYVQDTRVVGNVLYTVAQDSAWEYGWEYGWGYGGGGAVGVGGSTAPGPSVVLASVSFAGGVVTKVGEQVANGYGGIFNVTPYSIMLATQPASTDPSNPYGLSGQTTLQYIDITDSSGAIKPRGSITINGAISGWGPDNGRWNLDFSDGVHAHSIGCAGQYCGDSGDAYIVTTVDFTNPDTPAVLSSMSVANLGWSAAARFDVDPAGAYSRLYLSPNGSYSTTSGQTPLSIYDLADPTAPKLAGSTNLDGNIWLFIPNGDQLFALGNTYTPNGVYDQSLVEVQYVDVTDPSAPTPLGASQFGDGWSWSPAAETFKAFVVNQAQGLAVVPFSGWDSSSYAYTNGVELVQFTPAGLVSSGTARTKGWVERGIFVKNRLVSLSDQALAVIDYTNPAAPQVVTEMTLARNVVNARPQGATIAELSSDWYGNDVTSSEMRVLPIANAAETTDSAAAVSATVPGVDAQVFQNGALSYVVTDVQVPVTCQGGSPNGPSGTCVAVTQQVTVVDTSNGGAVLRGTATLPVLPYSYYNGWGWEGFWYYDWYDGANVVQVGGDALAFRRWLPQYSYDPTTGYPVYSDTLDALYVIDLSNADAPTLASLTITDDASAWWGDMQAIGDTLYTMHYEWVNRPDPSAPSGTVWWTKYYLDQIDLSNRAHPRVGQKINVPGTLVGSSSEDPSVLYFADYNWDGQNENDAIAACQVDGGKCYLQSYTQLDGYVGSVIVQNDKAYMTVQEYDWMAVDANGVYQTPYVELHQLDLTRPDAPVDRVSSNAQSGWGWLLSVQGDRAVVTSGWGPVAIDVYQLSDTAAPAYEQTVRTLGWGTNAITRQDNTLYLSSGYWGVQPIVLQ
jgi:hypothetical protein